MACVNRVSLRSTIDKVEKAFQAPNFKVSLKRLTVSLRKKFLELLCGLTRDTGPKEIIRATIESVAYQTSDLFDAMHHDGLKPRLVKVDGGMVMNNWFSQFLSDIIHTKVLRPKVQETTALGAAFMAGLKVGVYKSLKDISKNWHLDKKFFPKLNPQKRKYLLKDWKVAINRTLSKQS